jgi:hypothetical protein
MATTVTLFRGIKAEEPAATDFWSNKRRGKRPRKAEITNPKEYDAVSCWDSLEKVRKFARQFPQIGAFVAELHVLDDGPLDLVPEGDPGHWNVYGEPEQMLAYVHTVHPVT